MADDPAPGAPGGPDGRTSSPKTVLEREQVEAAADCAEESAAEVEAAGLPFADRDFTVVYGASLSRLRAAADAFCERCADAARQAELYATALRLTAQGIADADEANAFAFPDPQGN